MTNIFLLQISTKFKEVNKNMDNQTLQTKQQTLTLDFCQNSYKSILAKQYDNQTRYIPIRCTNCGQAFPLNQNFTAEIKILTPDGRPTFDLIPIQEDGTLLLELTESILAYPGKADAEIRIRDEDKLLSTMTFQIMIEPSVYDDDRIIASEEFGALNDLIKQATETYDHVIREAQASANMAKSYAVGGTDSRPNENTDNAQHYSEQASNYATDAETYMNSAKSHMDDAGFSQEAAANSAESASESADTANKKASDAQSYAESSQNYAELSQSYAVGGTGKRPDENISNAKYYYEQSKRISESFSGALRPMGTVTFSALPPLSTATEGDMYNVSDQFTTDASFKEGAGNVIPAGANVYKTSDGYWDVLAGTPVTGVKGNAENTYRRGNVNLTAENIGALPSDGNAVSATKAAQDGNGKNIAQTYALKNVYYDTAVNMGRKSNTAVGNKSFAFGNNVTASGAYSHAEGYNTSDTFTYSKYNEAEKVLSSNTVYGFTNASSSTGISAIYMPGGINTCFPSFPSASYTNCTFFATASPTCGWDYVEKTSQLNNVHYYGTKSESITSSNCTWLKNIMGVSSFNTGNVSSFSITGATTSWWNNLFNLNGNYGTVRIKRLALRYNIENKTVCKGYSHASGGYTYSPAQYSHAEGYENVATGIAQHVCGKYNKYDIAEFDGTSLGSQTGNAFIVGNGTGTDNRSNAFRVAYNGAVYGGAYSSSGADYAEYIYEWEDGNIDGEDRVGYFVTFADKKLKIAQSGDIILGIISGNPSVIGNSDEDYAHKYVRDDFNRIVYEKSNLKVQLTDDNGNLLLDEYGTPKTKALDIVIDKSKMKLSDNYDPNRRYTERKYRNEWDYVGMYGVLPVRDDGTCIAGEYCKCNDMGIATYATAEEAVNNRFTYIVLERVSEHVIKVVK